MIRIIFETLYEIFTNKAVYVAATTAGLPILIKMIGISFTSHKKTQKQTINHDNIINHILTELKHQADASLVFIFKYHNGGITYDGKPMEKMTMFYLRDSQHIQVDSNKYTNIPIAHWGDMVYHLYNSGILYQDDIVKCNQKDDLKDNRYRVMMDALNVTSHYAIPVFRYKWKVNLSWDTWLDIFIPLKRDKILIASIHTCLHKPYTEMYHDSLFKGRRISKAKIDINLLSEQLSQELVK